MTSPPCRDRGARAFDLVVFAGIVVLYAMSLDVSIGFWDTGEMQTVPYVLGIAHPTGYPTEILAGWLFSHGLPFGTPAARLTVLNALFGLIAAWCCQRIAVASGADGRLASLAALCYATSALPWTHATHVDVVTPCVALTAVALVLALEGRSGRSGLRWIAAGLATALAIGTHGSVVFAMPLLVITAAAGSRGRWRRLGVWACTALVLSCALYAYIPLRASYVERTGLDPTARLAGPGAPIWDWGRPSRPGAFVRLITGGDVGAATGLRDAFRPSALIASASNLREVVSSAAPAGIRLVFVITIALTLVTRRAGRLALLLPLVLTLPFAATFHAESDVERYLILPELLLWSLVATVAPSGDASSVGIRRRYALRGVLVLCAAANVYLLRGQFANPRDRLGDTYVAAVVARTPERAIVIAPWVYGTPLAYEAYAAGGLGDRTVLLGREDLLAPSSALWAQGRPVFVVDETPPHEDAHCTADGAFGVNPDPAHDPKLYACSRTGR